MLKLLTILQTLWHFFLVLLIGQNRWYGYAQVSKACSFIIAFWKIELFENPPNGQLDEALDNEHCFTHKSTTQYSMKETMIFMNRQAGMSTAFIYYIFVLLLRNQTMVNHAKVHLMLLSIFWAYVNLQATANRKNGLFFDLDFSALRLPPKNGYFPQKSCFHIKCSTGFR